MPCQRAKIQTRDGSRLKEHIKVRTIGDDSRNLLGEDRIQMRRECHVRGINIANLVNAYQDVSGIEPLILIGIKDRFATAVFKGIDNSWNIEIRQICQQVSRLKRFHLEATVSGAAAIGTTPALPFPAKGGKDVFQCMLAKSKV